MTACFARPLLGFHACLGQRTSSSNKSFQGDTTIFFLVKLCERRQTDISQKVILKPYVLNPKLLDGDPREDPE